MKMIHTHQTSKLTKKQREKQAAILEEQKQIKKELKDLQKKSPKSSLSPKIPSYRTNHQNIPSHDSGAGSTALKYTPKYTGDSMLGVAVIHKSCLQPVFSDQVAKDIASMRR